MHRHLALYHLILADVQRLFLKPEALSPECKRQLETLRETLRVSYDLKERLFIIEAQIDGQQFQHKWAETRFAFYQRGDNPAPVNPSSAADIDIKNAITAREVVKALVPEVPAIQMSSLPKSDAVSASEPGVGTFFLVAGLGLAYLGCRLSPSLLPFGDGTLLLGTAGMVFILLKCASVSLPLAVLACAFPILGNALFLPMSISDWEFVFFCLFYFCFLCLLERKNLLPLGAFVLGLNVPLTLYFPIDGKALCVLVLGSLPACLLFLSPHLATRKRLVLFTAGLGLSLTVVNVSGRALVGIPKTAPSLELSAPFFLSVICFCFGLLVLHWFLGTHRTLGQLLSSFALWAVFLITRNPAFAIPLLAISTSLAARRVWAPASAKETPRWVT